MRPESVTNQIRKLSDGIRSEQKKLVEQQKSKEKEKFMKTKERMRFRASTIGEHRMAESECATLVTVSLLNVNQQRMQNVKCRIDAFVFFNVATCSRINYGIVSM